MALHSVLKKIIASACVSAMLVTAFPAAGAVNYEKNTTKAAITVASTASSTAKITPNGAIFGVGENYKLRPNFGANSKKIWSTSNSCVIRVSSDGTIECREPGKAIVCCRALSGTKAIAEFTVKPAPKSIKLDTAAVTLGVGETHDFGSTLNAGAGSYQRHYYTSDASGAPVTMAGGLVTAKKAGTYTITCKAYNGVKTTAKVTVKNAPSSVTLSQTSASLEIGKAATLTSKLSSGSYSGSYTVSSSNSNVASASLVNGNKILVKAKKAGSTVVTFKTYNGKTAKCTVTVKTKSVALNISATSTPILKGNHSYIKATTSPSTGVTYSSSNTSVARVSSNGIVTGVGAGTAKITVAAGSTKKTCKITVSSYSSDTYVPYSSYTLNNGKTVYLKSTGSSFSSSDKSVCTVNSNGFVTAKKQGVAIITANYKGSKRTCAITVVGSEPVRFSYSSPNSASKNQKVELIAITDKQRTAVKFNIKIGKTTKTVFATKKSLNSSGNRYIWKGYYTFSSAGEYPVTAYSMYKNCGKYSTCAGGKSTVFVTNVTSAKTTSYSQRRPSNDILALNSSYEGFLSSVTDDPLVYDTPTVGYGYVVRNGDAFYNNMSKEEAFAFMVKTMNDSVYSSAVNNFMTSNSIKFNQQQFDALVMLVYNLGPGVLNDSDVSGILKNCWHNGVRDMNYVNKKALQSELIQWHHAGGCVWGLLYRRIDELEVFCYGDYVRDGSDNKYGMTYRWNCY